MKTKWFNLFVDSDKNTVVLQDGSIVPTIMYEGKEAINRGIALINEMSAKLDGQSTEPKLERAKEL